MRSKKVKVGQETLVSASTSWHSACVKRTRQCRAACFTDDMYANVSECVLFPEMVNQTNESRGNQYDGFQNFVWHRSD